ncbi:hypothetical protein ACQJBY_040607 [Aegilops geniculata]
MASSGEMVLAMTMMGLVAALVCPAAASQFISMPTDDVVLPDGLSYDFHAQSCPNLQDMVRAAVVTARNKDIGVVAGLLRVFFHDCFPNGCDASLLLEESPHYLSERMILPHNAGLHEGALNLIESIRNTVHITCKNVSCADITMLATREAVVLSGAPSYGVPLGWMDSFGPATFDEVDEFLLIPKYSKIFDLITVFGFRGFDKTDLVALSGAHTIGKTRCGRVDGRTLTPGDDVEFINFIKKVCKINPDHRQDLDVTTPNTFDNKYYRNLLAGKAVLGSDTELLLDGVTKDLVEKFAKDQGLFFSQFCKSMSKMAHISVGANYGEYRRNCFRPNFIRNLTAEGFVARD